MDQDTVVNLLLVLVFVLVGGVFAGTEIALVSLRESQVDQLEKQSKRGAKVAAVARDPNRFLAAVQIGVTVAGFFSAAYGASTLAPDFVPALVGLGLSDALADTVSVLALTLVVAYLSLVLGELVPKRLALQRAAGLALLVGPPLDRFARLMRPVIWLLSRSTDAVVRLLRATRTRLGAGQRRGAALPRRPEHQPRRGGEEDPARRVRRRGPLAGRGDASARRRRAPCRSRAACATC